MDFFSEQKNSKDFEQFDLLVLYLKLTSLFFMPHMDKIVQIRWINTDSSLDMNCFDSFECKVTIMNQMQLNCGRLPLSTQKTAVYEHLCYEERQRELGRLSLEKRSFRRTSSKYIKTSREGAKRMELGY